MPDAHEAEALVDAGHVVVGSGEEREVAAALHRVGEQPCDDATGEALASVRGERGHAHDLRDARDRDRAVAETGFGYDVFPEVCPYAFDDLMGREIVFAGA